jgi:hypothetical protein
MLTPAEEYGPILFNIVMYDFNCDFKPSYGVCCYLLFTDDGPVWTETRLNKNNGFNSFNSDLINHF